MPDRLALIIANGDFEDPKLSRLHTPTRDAEALAGVLGDPDIGNFDVELLVNQHEGVVRRTVERFYTRQKRRDLLLLYYSGHGIRDAYGDLYLAMKDTEMDIPSSSSLSASFVREQIDKSSSQRKVVVLDCCHSGAFVGAKAALGESVGTKDAFAGSGYGQVILTASDALELSWEGNEWLGEGQPSVFTHFLVKGLRTGAADLDATGQVSLDELYRYAHEQMLHSGAKQTPHRFLEIEGDIFIAYNSVEKLADQLFSKAIQAAFTGDLWEAKRYLDMILDEDPYYPRARELMNKIEMWLRRAAQSRQAAQMETAPEAIEDNIINNNVAVIASPIWLELVRVPAGEFLMDSDPEKDEDASSNEQPQHRVELPEFYIGKYPITNAQYEAFVQSTGHRAPRHWENDQAPADKADHPVVYVSWRDGIAFCEWLSEETGKDVQLPSEAEWEKAARGPDGRIYPWGNKSPTDDLCNFGENVGGTTSVGEYSPQGDSPYGCVDMAGNVWEWTRSLWGENYPYDPTDGREDLDAEGRRVLRGGAFYNSPADVRCAYRYRRYPLNRLSFLGFRVVVSSSSRTE